MLNFTAQHAKMDTNFNLNIDVLLVVASYMPDTTDFFFFVRASCVL
jgi:hypothetical protein